MDVQQARFVFEVQRIAERVDAQFDVTPFETPQPALVGAWRASLGDQLRRLADRLDRTTPSTARLA